VLPQYLKEMAEAREIIKSRKGLVSRETCRLILSCLHPDRVEDSKLKERYTTAFHAFSSLELVLCNEKEPLTTASKMPRTYEEMMRSVLKQWHAVASHLMECSRVPMVSADRFRRSLDARRPDPAATAKAARRPEAHWQFSGH
jgi:hypothetical protein